MSNIYHLEPPTKGKVVLHTSLGDLDVELWPKEAPKAVRNFVQLCLEGYYDNTRFHRVIKDYLVQGGDPTGTGEGGTSVYGEPFRDEFHSRLKFNHRGLLACANENEPHTNGTQFFLTLGPADWLDKKNTIFGKVTGDSIYNLIRIGELQADEQDVPLFPPVITDAEVLWNPFDDIVPRVDREARKAAEAQRLQLLADAKTRKRQQGGTKNLSLLSFGEEAGAEEEAIAVAAAGAPTKFKSAHDVLDDSRLAKEVAAEVEEAAADAEQAVKRQKTEGALAHMQAILGKAAGHTLHPKPTTLRRPRTPHASTTHRQQCWPGRGSLVQERRHPESGSAQPPGSEVKTPVLCAHACAPVPPPPPTLTARAGSEAPPSARIRQSSTQDGGDQDSGEEPRQPAVEPPDLASQMRARVNAARERSTRPRDTPPADPHPGPAPASRGEEEQLDRKRAEGSASEGGEDPPGGGDGRGSSGGRDATAGGGAGGPGSRPHDGKPDYAAERRAELQSQREDDSLQRTYGRARVTSEVTDADLLKPWQVSRAKFKQRKQQMGGREKDTMAKLAKFMTVLRSKGDAAPEAEPAIQPDASPKAAAAEEDETQGYDGKVDKKMDHKTYMPAAWRVDDYLGADEDDSLENLKRHELRFSKASGTDAMTRTETVDDYVVFDPLLEKGKGKFSKHAAKEKKLNSEWRQTGGGSERPRMT
ncbi:MAG: hypothetical protein WDW36_004016 [Sanguina aurantia]